MALRVHWRYFRLYFYEPEEQQRRACKDAYQRKLDTKM
jgi:hypothetical protein